MSRLVLSAVVVVLALHAPSRAQGGSREVIAIEDVSLEDLLGESTSVASSKSLKLRESPGVLTIITRDEIQALGAWELMDVLAYVPGIDFGVDVSNTVGMGFRGNWGNEGKILILLDGFEMNELAYATHELGGHYLLDDVERIEVLRGPGSAQYGGNAELAVVNIVTRRGSAVSGVELGARYALERDPLAQGGLFASYGDAYGGALEGLEVSVSAQAGAMTRSERIYRDVYGDGFAMGANMQLRPILVNGALRYHGFSARALFDGYTTNVLDGYDSVQEQVSPMRFPGGFLDLRYDLALPGEIVITPRVTLKRQAPWFTLEHEGNAIPDQIVLDRYRAGIAASWQALPKLALRVGLDGTYDAARLGVPDVVQAFLLDTNVLPGDEVTVYGNFSSYGEMVVDTSLFLLTAGARFEAHSAYGPSFVPRVALTRVFDRAHLKLLVSGAFRAPSYYNIALEPDVRPERTTVFEAEGGVQLTDFMYVTLNAFDITIHDPIIYFYDDETDTEGYLNESVTGTRGVEAEAWLHFDWGRVDVAYSMYTAAQKNAVVSYMVPGRDDVLLGMPTHKITLVAPLYLMERVTLTPSLIVRSELYADTGVDADGELVTTKLPPSALVNVFLSVRDLFVDGLSAGIGAKNLLSDPYALAQPYHGYHAPLPVDGLEVHARVAWAGF